MKTKTYEELKLKIGELEKKLNGGLGSGNFGHAGRPGKVGGSSKSNIISSAMRRKGFVKGDIVQGKTPDGEIVNGTYDRVEGTITIHDVVVGWDYANKKAIKGDKDVRAAIIIDKDGKEHKVPFYGEYVTMIRNVDAPDTTPAQRRTEKQKKALDEVFSNAMVSPSEQRWFKANCSEDTAIALNNALKDAKADGIDISEISIAHNARLKSTLARVVYGRSFDNARLNIEIGNLACFDGEGFKQRQQKNYDDGWHTSPTIEGIIKHELGHAKEAQIIINESKKRGGWITSGILLCEMAELSRTIIKEATGKTFATLTYGKGKDVSKYAVKDLSPSETIAESYSNPDFSSATKKIAAKLDEYAKKGYNYNMAIDKTTNQIQQEGMENSLCTGYPMSEEDWEILHGHKTEPVGDIPEGEEWQ